MTNFDAIAKTCPQQVNGDCKIQPMFPEWNENEFYGYESCGERLCPVWHFVKLISNNQQGGQ